MRAIVLIIGVLFFAHAAAQVGRPVWGESSGARYDSREGDAKRAAEARDRERQREREREREREAARERDRYFNPPPR